MHAFAVLADPVRRCIVEQLMDRTHSSGELVDTVGEKFGISQSAISQQLKVLRENGFASVAIDGNRRLYSLDSKGFEQMDEWLAPDFLWFINISYFYVSSFAIVWSSYRL